MASRVPARLLVLRRAVTQRLIHLGRRQPSPDPGRILIAHHLLLGDTLMLTPLIAKLRALHPRAEIVMTVPAAIAPLYQRQPYGVTVWPWDPRDPNSVRPMLARQGFDLAVVPGANRHSWLALALGARWIVAHAGDRPAYTNWPVDDLIPYPVTPAAWGDMAAQLIDGPPPPPYYPADWPAPDCAPFDVPTGPYAVLHVGASSPLRLWQPQGWRALATMLTGRGYAVVWSSGRGEEEIAAAIDPDRRYASYAGILDLPQLWHLLRDAALLVCPDTGVAHLGRLTNTPTVTLFGPGSAILFGAGDFWRASAYRAVTVDPFPCRDQRTLFKREIDWVRRCQRSLRECPAPRCMQAIDVPAVERAINELLEPT